MLNVNGVAINFDGQNLFSNVNLQFLPGCMAKILMN